MNVLILGGGPSYAEADFESREWDEVWGLPWFEYWPKCTRLFEMHDERLLETGEARPADYISRLREIWVPLYMQARNPGYPMSVAYPLERVRNLVFQGFPRGGDYLGSSPAYMIALALAEDAERIGVWGVDLRDDADKYDHQQANLEWLLGVAHGHGIEVRVAEKSRLLKHRANQKFGTMPVLYPSRYGCLT